MLGVLKQGPSTAPGAAIKLNTALNKFRGVGSKIAASKTCPSRTSSLDQQERIDSFHVEVAYAGILRALVIVLVRQGIRSLKDGRLVKTGMGILSAEGAAMKTAVDSAGDDAGETGGAGGEEREVAVVWAEGGVGRSGALGVFRYFLAGTVAAVDEGVSVLGGDVSVCEGDVSVCEGVVSVVSVCGGGVSMFKGNACVCEGVVSVCEGVASVCEGVISVVSACGVDVSVFGGDVSVCDGVRSGCV